MAEKIMVEFTGEEMDMILEYQRKMSVNVDENLRKRFPDATNIDTVQKAIMNAIKKGLCDLSFIV